MLLSVEGSDKWAPRASNGKSPDSRALRVFMFDLGVAVSTSFTADESNSVIYCSDGLRSAEY